MNETEDYMRRVHRFALRCRGLYETRQKDAAAFHDEFASACISLGFENDQGKALSAAYGSSILNDPDLLEQCLSDTGDIRMIGNAVLSRWYDIERNGKGDFLTPENRAWMISALSRLIEITDIHRDRSFDFGNAVSSVKITSEKTIWGTGPKEQTETRQTLVIKKNGLWTCRRWWVSPEKHKTECFEVMKGKIPEESAAHILRDVCGYFSTEPFGLYGEDASMYEIKITSDTKRTYTARGVMDENSEETAVLSDMIREYLGRDILFVFDGGKQDAGEL